MSEKRLMPYARLLKDVREWAYKVIYPHNPTIFTFANAKGYDTQWRLCDLYQRVAAADTLGYDVELKIVGNDLVARYRKKIPDAPWQLEL